MKNLKIKEQRGVSLIITFFIMIIILAVVLSVAIILYSEIKVIKNIGNSIVSFYAADSGIEKVLYYDNRVLPTHQDADGNDVPAVRGLCSMFDSASEKYCQNESGEIYCKSTHAQNLSMSYDGCSPETCNNCEISFETNFAGKKYYTSAEVSTEEGSLETAFTIKSRGVFGGASRKIEVSMSSATAPEAIQVIYACATPKSQEQGSSIEISAYVISNLRCESPENCVTIGSVVAHIYDASNEEVGSVDLVCQGGNFRKCEWIGTWSANSSGGYIVNLYVKDTFGESGNENEVVCPYLIPVPTCYYNAPICNAL